MVLTPIQSKIQASKVSEFATSCANEYAKEKEEEKEEKEEEKEEEEKEEKEKNTTIFTKNHGKVLAATSDYLLHNILV